MRRHSRRKARGKQIASHSILGQQGINLVEQRLLGMGFVWYPAGGLEAGIDGHFEIRDPVTGELGVAKDRGIYFAPPPKREELYSNLLEIVGLPNRIFIAEASQATTREAWEALRRQSDKPESEWILKSKRIMSVHDLRVPPWTSICDRGSVEDFPTGEWAA